MPLDSEAEDIIWHVMKEDLVTFYYSRASQPFYELWEIPLKTEAGNRRWCPGVKVPHLLNYIISSSPVI
jgi:hypothetical protein